MVYLHIDLDMQPQSIKKKELDGILVWELEYQPSWVWSTTGMVGEISFPALGWDFCGFYEN